MSLTAADVAEIMRLVEQSSFDELILEMDGVKLCLRRGGGVSRAAAGDSSGFGAPTGAVTSGPNSAARASAANGTATGAAATPAAAAVKSAPAPSTDPNVIDVPSPLLGTFYRAPKPGAAPFVDVGSVVEPDTVVAIIEVMKLMNTVRAGVRGTVTEILPADGSLVEYEQPLLRVRKSG